MNENFNSLPKEERPYERCMRHGAEQLSDRELLAVLLRTGARGRTVLELGNREGEGGSAEMRSGAGQKDGAGRGRTGDLFPDARHDRGILYGGSEASGAGSASASDAEPERQAAERKIYV